jgi:hypothetical protein
MRIEKLTAKNYIAAHWIQDGVVAGRDLKAEAA